MAESSRQRESVSAPADSRRWTQDDRWCDCFEAEWRVGKGRPAESFLAELPKPWPESLLEDLLCIEIEYRRRMGQRVDFGVLVRRFPGRDSWVRKLLVTARTEEQVLLPGEMLGRYRIEQAVAQGAFGAVYRAHDETLDRTVAIKVARAASVSCLGSERLRHESHLLASLCHPHIVPIYDFGELENGVPYLVLEFLAGRALDERLERGPLPWRQAVEWTAQIADAVHYLHLRGTIHRDLKPANIVLDDDNRARVTDFGLAFQMHSAASIAEGFAGTPCYMAPEQLRPDAPVTRAVDIWALGAILYECLAGQRPYTREQLEQAAESELPPLPSPSRQQPDVPPALDRICHRCLQWDPAERFSSAGHLARQLRAALNRQRRVGRRRALAACSLATAGAVAGWRWFVKTPVSPSSPLRCSAGVFAWNPVQGPRWIDQPGALPLLPGDTVRLQASASVPAHLYIVWIDGEGTTIPLFPGKEGTWQWQPSRLQSEIGLPDSHSEGWKMEVVRPAMETVLVMARRAPLADAQVSTVHDALLPWKPQPPTQTAGLFTFRNGRLVRTKRQTTRKPRLENSLPFAHALFQNQRLVAERLVPLFDDIIGLTFSCDVDSYHVPVHPDSKGTEG